MPWLNRHQRLRDQLSPYLDGELAPRPREALERHLASCEPCRRELTGLRAAARALADLPEVDVPRSFTLTPEQVRPPAPRPLLPRPPLAAPLLAGALAFALAALLVVDLGDIGGGGPAATRQEAPAAQERTGADRAPAEAQGPAAGDEFAGGPATGAGVPQPTPEAVVPAPTPGASGGIQEGGDVTRAQPSPPPQAGPAAAPAAEAGGGLDPLRAAEIALGAALAALVVGVAGYAAWIRRRIS